jgi:hypothetical protein
MMKAASLFLFATAAVKAQVCSTPTTISTTILYETAENDLSINSFDVRATCAAGASGVASVVACTRDGEEYTLSGCSDECIRQVGEYYTCSSSTSCEYTSTQYGETELSASVEVSATGEAGFASATASASASGSSTTGLSTSSTFEVSGGTCKYNVLHVTSDYSVDGCAASKTIYSPPHAALAGMGSCEVDYAGISNIYGSSDELQACCDSHINQFIAACGMLPPPPSSPTGTSSQAPGLASSANIPLLTSGLCACACALLFWA